MRTDRPYSSGIASREAIAELRACSGTQFDPEVVEAFIATLSEPERGPEPLSGERPVAVEQPGSATATDSAGGASRRLRR
jgi:HD-GYP domain-containing protein (c-di-GMP phosphodiesterase class II)